MAAIVLAGLVMARGAAAADAAKMPGDPETGLDYTHRRIEAGACWRGNLMRTGEYQTRGVAANPRAKWAIETGGPVRSSPVVFGGTIYVGTVAGVLALDAASGAKRWELPVKGGVVSSACVADLPAPSPAGGQAGLPAPPGGGQADVVVYIGGNDGRLYAIDAGSGEVKWKVDGKGLVFSSPAVAYGLVFMEGPVAFDALSGGRIWGKQIATFDDGRLTSVAIAGGQLIQNIGVCDIQEGRFAVGRGGPWIGENVEAVWGEMVFTAQSGTGGGVGSLGGGGGAIAALDLATLRTKWVRSTAAAESTGKREVLLCSPAVVNGVVYIGTDHGEMLAIDALRGKDVWATKAGGSIRSCPSVSTEDGIVCVGCDDGKLYGFDAKTGEKKWDFATGGKIQSSPCPSGGVVYVGSDDGKVYAIVGGDAP